MEKFIITIAKKFFYEDAKKATTDLCAKTKIKYIRSSSIESEKC